MPVASRGRTIGAVRVTESVDAVNKEQRNDVIALIGVGLVALLLGVVVAWLLAGTLANPLRGLARAARRVAGGDLDARAKVEGSTEQREVATAFNDMTGQMATTLRGQREFVANASHQLRTPLTGLAAAARGGRPEEPRSRGRARAGRRRARDRAARAAPLRAPHPRRRWRAAGGTAARRGRGCRRRLRSLAGTGRAVGARARRGAWAAGGCCRLGEDLAAILDNLTENALNYSPPGTAVTLTWAIDDDRVRLAVLDEGPGLDPDEGERVFQRFYRGSASTNGAAGTGLGLAVVEALAARWGGEVTLANRPEGGARAEVALQAVRALPKPDPELDESLPGRS